MMTRKLVAAGLAGLAWAGAGCGNPAQADTDSPIVFIVSPKADSTVSGQVAFSAQVFDGFGVAKVVFKVDGVVLLEDLAEPYGVVWATQGAGNGPHALRVEATDFAGNVGFRSIGVTVDNSRQ